jgi:hypothetical protein
VLTALTQAWIITAEEEEELIIDDIHISIKPAWNWMITP